MNENNRQHIFADWCLNQWKKRKKVIIFFFSSKVVWTLAIFVVFYFCTDLMFGNLLKKIIEKSTNYTYTFEYSTFRYNFFTNKIFFEDVDFFESSSSDSVSSFQSIHVDEIYLNGFSFYSFLIKNEIDFSELSFQGTKAHINLHNDSLSNNISDSISKNSPELIRKKVTEKLQSFFKKRTQKFGVEKFIFNNASIYLHHSQDSSQDISINDFNLRVEAILINDSTLQFIDSNFFFQQFEFSFGKNDWSFKNKDNQIHVAFDSLYYSSKNKKTIAENLSGKFEKDLESMSLFASTFSIENLDFENIINDKKIQPDTLKIIDSDLRLTFVEKKKNTSYSMNFEKFLQNIYPISLKHFALENNRVAIKWIKQQQPPLFFQSTVNLYLDDFELNKLTFKEKQLNLFSKSFELHFSNVESSQQGKFHLILDDFECNSNQKDLELQGLFYKNLAHNDLQYFRLQYLKLLQFEWNSLLTNKQLDIKTVLAKEGDLCWKNGHEKAPTTEKMSFSFSLPDNEWINKIRIPHLNVEDFDVKFLNHRQEIQADCSNIDLDIRQLNISKNATYSILDMDFCSTMTLGTDKSNFFVNDNFYKVSWGQFNTDFDHLIQCEDFSVQPTKPKEQLIKEMVILPPQIIQADVGLLEIQRFNFPLFFKYGIIQVESIYSDSSNIQIYKTEFSSKEGDIEIATATAESILFENGNLIYENADSYLKINRFLLDIQLLNIPDFREGSQSMKFENFVFEYDDQLFEDSTTTLKSKKLKLDHKKEELKVGNISLNKHQSNQSLQELNIRLQQLQLSNFDYRTLILNRILYATDLSVKSIAFDSKLDFDFASVDSVNNTKPLLQQILIRTVSISDISNQLLIRDTQDETYQIKFNKSYVKANNVNWMPNMQGFPHRGKLQVGIKNLQSSMQQAQKTIHLDSLIFSLHPDQAQIYNIAYHDLKTGAICENVDIQNITVLKPQMDSLFVSKKFLSEKLLFNNGDVVLNLNHWQKPDSITKAKNPPKEFKESSINQLPIFDIFQQICFSDIRLKIIQEGREQIVSLDDGVMDKKNGRTVSIGSMNFLTNHDLVNFGFKNILLSSKYRRLIIDSCYYTPIISKEEWGQRFGYQNDWTKFSIRSVLLEGVTLNELITQKICHIPFVRIHQLVLEDYRDKRLPFPENHYPGMPQDMLRKIPKPLIIDSLVISSSKFTYEEQVEYAMEQGKIWLSNATIQGSNITNEASSVLEPMRFNVSMMLMDSAKLTGQLSFDLKDTLNYFEVSAQLEPMNMPLLNPVLENLAFLTIKSGYCQSMDMNFHGNKNYALGSMLFKYNNFKIGLIDKKKLHPSSGTNFVAFLANTFVVRRSNPTTLFPRTGIMYFEPDPHKSIFNYLFKTALSGIKHTIGLSEQKAKDKDSESYSTYVQERKQLIKSHKQQKKLEKKLSRKGVNSDYGKKINK